MNWIAEIFIFTAGLIVGYGLGSRLYWKGLAKGRIEGVSTGIARELSRWIDLARDAMDRGKPWDGITVPPQEEDKGFE